GPRQLASALRDRTLTVTSFFLAHCLEYRAAAPIAGGQPVEVAGQVLFDLALGFGDEAERPAIAEDAARGADQPRAGEPERAEQARRGLELAQALFAPGEVIALLVGGVPQVRRRLGALRDRRMTFVQALRRDLAGVVHTHEGGCTPPLVVGEGCLGNAVRGAGARGPRRRRGDAAHEAINCREQAIERRQQAILHPANYTRGVASSG